MGGDDYLAIAETFHTVLIEGVPLLSEAKHDLTRRFIVLIDQLYERRCRVRCPSLNPKPQSHATFKPTWNIQASQG